MKTKTKHACPPAKRGSALLLSTILLFVVLSMVVSLSYVTVMEQQMSSKTKSSVGSFFNADSGVEWALNKIANATGDKISDVFSLSGDGSTTPSLDAGYKVYLLDSEGKVINSSNPKVDISEIKAVRAVGTQGGETQRAIEAAVAQSGGYSFMYYCFSNFPSSTYGTPVCTNTVGSQGFCPTGYIQKADLGSWGACFCNLPSVGATYYFLPPGGSCSCGAMVTAGNAYVCSQ